MVTAYTNILTIEIYMDIKHKPQYVDIELPSTGLVDKLCIHKCIEQNKYSNDNKICIHQEKRRYYLSIL